MPDELHEVNATSKHPSSQSEVRTQREVRRDANVCRSNSPAPKHNQEQSPLEQGDGKKKGQKAQFNKKKGDKKVDPTFIDSDFPFREEGSGFVPERRTPPMILSRLTPTAPSVVTSTGDLDNGSGFGIDDEDYRPDKGGWGSGDSDIRDDDFEGSGAMPSDLLPRIRPSTTRPPPIILPTFTTTVSTPATRTTTMAATTTNATTTPASALPHTTPLHRRIFDVSQTTSSVTTGTTFVATLRPVSSTTPAAIEAPAFVFSPSSRVPSVTMTTTLEPEEEETEEPEGPELLPGAGDLEEEIEEDSEEEYSQEVDSEKQGRVRSTTPAWIDHVPLERTTAEAGRESFRILPVAATPATETDSTEEERVEEPETFTPASATPYTTRPDDFLWTPHTHAARPSSTPPAAIDRESGVDRTVDTSSSTEDGEGWPGTTPSLEESSESTTRDPFVSTPRRKNWDIFLRPGVLAAVIGGAVVGLLTALLLVMFVVHRMRKKDEGTYVLDEPKTPPSYPSYAYQKAPMKEFYA